MFCRPMLRKEVERTEKAITDIDQKKIDLAKSIALAKDKFRLHCQELGIQVKRTTLGNALVLTVISGNEYQGGTGWSSLKATGNIC